MTVAISITAGKTTSSVLRGIPRSARDLIWRTFFVDAGRGVDFATHLPWHAGPTVRTIMCSNKAGQAVAVAVVRPSRQVGVAMVGYVCVDTRARGQGFGRDLIASVNEAIDDLGYRAALLWTGKPDVYAGQGYAVVRRDDFVQVECRASDRPAPAGFAATAWPGARDEGGLPAFATGGRRLRSDRAEAIVVEGARGATLIGWKGGTAKVAELVCAGGCPAWSVNPPVGHDFVQALPPGRYDVRIEPGATTMMRCADPSFVPDFVPVADRI